jgi:hypothetical protein
MFVVIEYEYGEPYAKKVFGPFTQQAANVFKESQGDNEYLCDVVRLEDES